MRACIMFAMSWVDLIDGANDFMSRKLKRNMGIGIVLAFVVFPNPARHALSWYANERADQIVSIVLENIEPIPVPSPAVEPRSPSGAPAGASSEHRKRDSPH